MLAVSLVFIFNKCLSFFRIFFVVVVAFVFVFLFFWANLYEQLLKKNMKQLTFPQPLALKFKQNRRIIIKFLQKKKQQQQQKEQQQKQQNQN